MTQLGSAFLAVVIMLACAALSERFIPTVASQEVTPVPMIAADTAVRVVSEPSRYHRSPHVPDSLVMLLVGAVLMGLGGALRKPGHEGKDE